MIVVHLDDFTTGCLIFSLCVFLVGSAVDLTIKAWKTYLEIKLEESKRSKP